VGNISDFNIKVHYFYNNYLFKVEIKIYFSFLVLKMLFSFFFVKFHDPIVELLEDPRREEL
jgi:hypothetical protein